MMSAHDTAQGFLPLMIGVTGHRDLREEDRDDLENQVRRIFNKEIRGNYPYTPMVLLSPLANGADRLVAKVALEPEFKARLIVPLPMSRTLYERDFQTPASQAEFNDFLQKAEKWFELPLIPGNTEENIREYGKQRDLQYETVGKFIVRHSQILIALWDGEPSEKVGGTAQIVQYWLNEFPQRSLINPPDPVKSGPVYHIMTPRVNGPDKAIAYKKLFPEGYLSDEEAKKGYTNDKKAEEIYNRIYKNIDRFNEDALNLESELTAKQETIKSYFPPEQETKTLLHNLKFIRECYATADTLALHFQRKTLETLWALCFFVFMAVFFFEAYAHVLREIHIFTSHEIRIFLFLYPISLIVAIICYYLAKRDDYQNKYQDYRALAEGLRVQFFWRLAGLPTSVEKYYLGRQRRELDWIRSAIRTCWSITEGKVTSTVSSGKMPRRERMRLVLEYWVKSQYKYFNDIAGPRDKKKMKFLELWRNYLLLLGIGAVFFAVPVPLLFRPNFNNWLEQHRLIYGLLLIVIVSLPAVIVALLQVYAEKKALSAQAKKYGTMKILREGLRDLVDSSLLWGVVGVFFTVLVILFWLEPHELIHGLLLIVIVSLPAVIAALLQVYAEKKALSAQAKQYAAMKIPFGKARWRLRDLLDSGEYDAEKYKKSQALVEELGKEALVENGDWVLMHRERPLEIPR